MHREDRYDSLIQFYSNENRLDWLKIKAQIKAESAFDPNVVNPRTMAKGLAQFMARTWEEWKDGIPGLGDPPLVATGPDARRIAENLLDPRDPEDAILSMCAYMRWLLRQFEQNDSKALAAYNWGIGNVKRCVERYGVTWLQHIPMETQLYIRKIHDYYAEYSRPAGSNVG
jgi:soluble lytic murein transglycosylase-like protein